MWLLDFFLLVKDFLRHTDSAQYFTFICSSMATSSGQGPKECKQQKWASSGLFCRNGVKSLVLLKAIRVERLLLRIRKSQLRWFKHLDTLEAKDRVKKICEKLMRKQTSLKSRWRDINFCKLSPINVITPNKCTYNYWVQSNIWWQIFLKVGSSVFSVLFFNFSLIWVFQILLHKAYRLSYNM